MNQESQLELSIPYVNSGIEFIKHYFIEKQLDLLFLLMFHAVRKLPRLLFNTKMVFFFFKPENI